MQFYRRLMPVQALSFDLDDTLYDNVPVMQRAEQAVREFVVREFPQTASWQAADWSAHRMALMRREPDLASNMTQLRLRALTAGLQSFGVNDEEAHAGAEAAFAHFMAHRNAVDIAPTVHQHLAALAERYPLYALSNGNVNVDAIGLGAYFQGVLQPSDSLRGKPFADMFKAAAAMQQQLAPHNWLHVGDSPNADILGAHRVGWQSAWFTGGLGRAEHLHVLPTLAYHDLAQLTRFLLKTV